MRKKRGRRRKEEEEVVCFIDQNVKETDDSDAELIGCSTATATTGPTCDFISVFFVGSSFFLKRSRFEAHLTQSQVQLFAVDDIKLIE
jgi:hypothetical protein